MLRDVSMIVVLADCKILLSLGREIASSKSVAWLWSSFEVGYENSRGIEGFRMRGQWV